LALMTAATLSIIDRETRWLRGLRPLLGSAALTLAVAPWLFAIERASDGRFLADAFGQDLLPKLLQGRESHGAPPFSYILMILVTFWPGSLLLVHGGIRGWRRYRAPAERFLLAWILPAWALLELVPTKLPHYVLPLLPAVALLTAAAISNRAGEPCGSWPRRLDVLVRGLWVAITVGLAALLIGLPLRFGGAITAAGVLGAGSLVALAAMLLRRRPGPDRTAGAIAALSLAFAVPAGWSVLPGLDRLWLSRAAAQLVAQHAPAPGTPLVAVGYSEPSLVFLLGTKLRLTTPLGAADLLRGGGEALVSGRDDAAFRQDVGAHGLASRPVGSVAGLDYSNGQRLALTLYVVARNETAPE
jgi:4-amino-4-deoxy-L-arabinose transferase-like glycosyltransferase